MQSAAIRLWNASFKTAALAILAAISPSQEALAITPAQISAWQLDGSLLELQITGSRVVSPLIENYIVNNLATPNTLDVYQSGSNYKAYAFRSKNSISSSTGGPGYIYAGRPILISINWTSSITSTRTLINPDYYSYYKINPSSCQSFDNTTRNPDDNYYYPYEITASFDCPQTIISKAHAAILELEPDLITSTINGGFGENTDSLDFVPIVERIYAIAVNKKLYLALQKAQGLVPLTASALDESAAAQPSIPKAFVAGALTGQLLGSSTNKKGWNLLIPTTVDANVNSKRINVCRGLPSAGTQAASNRYFANNPCGGSANQFSPTTGSATATLAVTGSSTTLQNAYATGIGTCLKTVDNLVDSAGDGYAFGVMGRDEIPNPSVEGVLQDRQYRFVKLSGMAPNQDSASSGEYDFTGTVYMAWPKAGQPNALDDTTFTLLSKIRTAAGAADDSLALGSFYGAGFLISPQNYPWPAAWADLPSNMRRYSSHTSRTSSCTPARIIK